MIRLIKIVPEGNLSRFYLLQVTPGLFGNWAVIREWGRIGQPGTVKTEWFDSEEEAEAAKTKLVQLKSGRGYT